MYITIKSIKKTLGKYIEFTDLYLGVPMLMIFLIMFSLTNLKIPALVFLTICIFLMLPINISKKNRMYKVIALVIKYIFKTKDYYYTKDEIKESKVMMINEFIKK